MQVLVTSYYWSLRWLHLVSIFPLLELLHSVLHEAKEEGWQGKGAISDLFKFIYFIFFTLSIIFAKEMEE